MMKTSKLLLVTIALAMLSPMCADAQHSTPPILLGTVGAWQQWNDAEVRFATTSPSAQFRLRDATTLSGGTVRHRLAFGVAGAALGAVVGAFVGWHVAANRVEHAQDRSLAEVEKPFEAARFGGIGGLIGFGIGFSLAPTTPSTTTGSAQPATVELASHRSAVEMGGIVGGVVGVWIGHKIRDRRP